MIYIADGPSVYDPADLLRIRYRDENNPKPPEGVVDFISFAGMPLRPVQVFYKSWWVNLYRVSLVGLIRRHVLRTIKQNKEVL